ncbi:MAG: hypothetical protein AMXMBFR33_57610 [Candidatus Xenobia bacterium]
MSSVRRQLELLQRTRPAAPAPISEPREEEGPFLLRSWEADVAHAHGPWPLTSVRGFSRCWLERLGLPELDPERVIFLDTETTGLSGGTGTYAFLIGLAWVEDGRLVVEQLLMREYKEEAALLGYLKERLEGCGGLVTYNGKSFDLQLLQTRFIMKRLKVDLESIPHLDLLHPCRRIWGSSYADCRLETLESELLGQPRSHDVPGWMIPRIYFNFLRSQNLSSLRRILEHNRRDLLALMGLVGALRGCLEQPEQPREGLADFGLGRWLEELGLQKLGWQLMERALSRSLPPVHRRSAALRVARARRRAGDQGGAANLWAELLTEHPHDPAAGVELAKYLEHHRKDYQAALQLVEGVLSRRDLPASLRRALQERQGRLLKRVSADCP